MHIVPVSSFGGEISSSPSKSFSHRAFALALLATSPSFIINPLTEGDLAVTINFCRMFGAQIIEEPNIEGKEQCRQYQVIPPTELETQSEPFNGKNSGTSIRILTALSALCQGDTQIYGMFFDRKRPLQPLLDALAQIGVESETIEDPLGVSIHPVDSHAGPIEIPGDISSQFITGLMILSPHLRGSETTIMITTPAKSFPYLQITEDILRSFNIQFTGNFTEDLIGSYIIPGNQTFSGITYEVPGDFSSAAFILVAAAINPNEEIITIKNLDMASPQGDKMIVEILKNMGAKLEVDSENKSIKVTGGASLQGISIDCSQIPDLFPILCVLGLYASGETYIYNAGHVRLKETDRLMVMTRELGKMGGLLDEAPDSITILGPQLLHGSEIIHDRDHRIAMALTIATLFSDSESTIDSPDVVVDSYPGFWDDLKQLGIHLIEE